MEILDTHPSFHFGQQSQFWTHIIIWYKSIVSKIRNYQIGYNLVKTIQNYTHSYKFNDKWDDYKACPVPCQSFVQTLESVHVSSSFQFSRNLFD